MMEFKVWSQHFSCGWFVLRGGAAQRLGTTWMFTRFSPEDGAGGGGRGGGAGGGGGGRALCLEWREHNPGILNQG